MRRVVVTGIGALTPIGNDIKSYKEGLFNGVSGAGPITNFDASQFRTTFGCEIKGYNPEDFFHRKEVRKMDPFTQYAVISADQAIANSGIDWEQVDLTKAGVIWGSGIGGFEVLESEISYAAKNDLYSSNRFYRW